MCTERKQAKNATLDRESLGQQKVSIHQSVQGFSIRTVLPSQTL